MLQEGTVPADTSDIVDLLKASDSAVSNVDTDDGTMSDLFMLYIFMSRELINSFLLWVIHSVAWQCEYVSVILAPSICCISEALQT